MIKEETRPGAGESREQSGAARIEEESSWGWTRRQRVGLGILLAFLMAMLTIQYVRRPYRLDDPRIVVDGVPVTLPDRVDPNTATLEELARIPHIGESRAGKIIEWRDMRRGTVADGMVFHRVEDLDAVPGVGPKLVEELRAYLSFHEDSAGSAE